MLKYGALMVLIVHGENISESEVVDCIDATALGEYKDCFDNVTWAMETGQKKFPEWYADYPILSESQSFAAYQWVLYDKTGLGGGKGYNCPKPCGAAPAPCMDITNSSPGQCYENTIWAMTTGITDFPYYYANYTAKGLSTASTFNDFQWVLHDKVNKDEEIGSVMGDGAGWQCPRPCTSPLFGDVTSTTISTSTTPEAPSTVVTSTTGEVLAGSTTLVVADITGIDVGDFLTLSSNGITETQQVIAVAASGGRRLAAAGIVTVNSAYANTFPAGTAVTASQVPPPTTTTSSTTSTTTSTTTTTQSSSSFPWWAWLLSICGLLLCLGGLGALFYTKKAPQKKKRSTTPKKSVPTPPPSAPMAAPAPVTAVTTAPPVYTQFAQPVQTVQTAQPVYARAAMPAQMAPVPMAAPAQAMAVPTYQYGAAPAVQQASALFDQMDVNHDGVITRAEFARLMGR